MVKKTTPNPGGWRTSDFINMIYDKRKMSSLSKDNIIKASQKGAGVVIFAVVVNLIGKYTVRNQPLPAHSVSGGVKLFVASTAGILATKYAQEKCMKRSS